MPPPSTFWRSILILSFHICLRILCGLLHSVFLYLHSVCASSVRHTCHIFLDFIIPVIFGKIYRSWISSICNPHHSSVIRFLLGPNVFLSMAFSKAVSSFSVQNVSDKCLHPREITDRIVISTVTNKEKCLLAKIIPWILYTAHRSSEILRYWSTTRDARTINFSSWMFTG